MVQISTGSKFDDNFKFPVFPLPASSIILVNEGDFEFLCLKRKSPSCIKTLTSIIGRKTLSKMGFFVQFNQLFHYSSINNP